MMIGGLTYGIYEISLALTVMSFKYEMFKSILTYELVCAIVILCSILCGIGAGLLWVA